MVLLSVPQAFFGLALNGWVLALIIIFLIPLALKGVRYRHVPAIQLLRSNTLIYGVTGFIIPFIGIKLIDMLLKLLGLT